MDKLELLHHIFPKNIQDILEKAPITYYKLQEVRLRVNEPLIIIYDNKEYLFGKDGRMERQCKLPYIVTATEIKETLEYVSSHSLYAYEDEIRQGFITVQGGHRVGIAGKVVMEEGIIKNVKYISFLNIRISHQVLGCSDDIMPYITKSNEIYHTLIISPPRCGKTTLLRDMIRSISNGFEEFQGATVGVVDERSEIGACFLGEPQNDLGIRTDVLDCCPKAKGMLMLIRSMSPQVIAVDEIGHREDLEAIEYVINCGCKLIATVHGNSIDDIKSKPLLRKLVQERVFERYIILNNLDPIGNISDIFDSQGNQLYHA